MAAYSDNDSVNAETESEHSLSVDFSDFVKTCVFPQCVCVTEGTFLSRDVQVSSGDVLLLKSCDNGQVTLSYRNDSSHLWTEVSVDLEYPQKFHVLPPKDTNTENRAVSMVMYPTISDLMLDCPTYFEATASFDDPYLPAMSVKVGDRFWFVEIVRNSREGVDRLKVRHEMGNILFLSLECRGNFCPLKDGNVYTVKELVELAPVPRRLQMVTEEPSSVGSSDKTDIKVNEGQPTDNEYTQVIKPSNKANLSISSSSSSLDFAVPSQRCLPSSLNGIVHLLKYESAITVSPYNDPDTTWIIPVSANIKVRNYSQSDYEVPAPRNQLFQNRVPLPLQLDNDSPRFRAPSTPPLHQPLVPININNFVDIYCSTFPVKAKILDTSEAHPFFQAMLRNVDEIIVYRLEEARRLYVKDVKSDTVYSLSHDLKLSFVEYPEKFNTVSELLHLPTGTDVTIQEDIAADFPKPFSLRLGDIIRLTSNTPYFIKMKHAHRDCQVIKCERIDPNGGENTKLKLPMDLEVSMVMTVDSNSRRMIPLQDFLTGVAPIPNQTVASVPDASEAAVLKDLPVDLRILKSMKDTYIVTASGTANKFFFMASSKNLTSSGSVKEKAVLLSSRQEQALLTNIGLPLTSGIVLAFRDRLDLFELDRRESEADYLRLPVEKITLTQFEERERFQKLNSDYEDVEFGSNSTVDECGAGGSNITRTNSTGVLERKQKNTAMDKVLRLSRALNPKHWRHSKPEPEPLPHPSAMGLMALAARPKEDTLNEYHHTRMDSASSSVKGGSVKDESITTSSEEEENFYEDVEIGPIRASTIAATPPRQTGAFSGPAHKSLPHRMNPSQLTRCSDSRSRGHGSSHTAASSEATESPTSRTNSNIEEHTYDIPTPLTKAKNWGADIGNNIGERFNSKPRYDIPKSNMIKEEKEQIIKTASVTTSEHKAPPNTKPPLPPPNANSKVLAKTEIKDAGNPPIPPARRKGRKPSSWVIDATKGQNNEGQEKTLPQGLSKSISLNDSVSSASESSGVPKPRPRGLKKPESSEEISSIDPSPLPRSRLEDIVKSVETPPDIHQSVNSEASHLVAKENLRPQPPPKPRVSTHTTV